MMLMLASFCGLFPAALVRFCLASGAMCNYGANTTCRQTPRGSSVGFTKHYLSLRCIGTFCQTVLTLITPKPKAQELGKAQLGRYQQVLIRQA